jgi:hypothetical protein
MLLRLRYSQSVVEPHHRIHRLFEPEDKHTHTRFTQVSRNIQTTISGCSTFAPSHLRPVAHHTGILFESHDSRTSTPLVGSCSVPRFITSSLTLAHSLTLSHFSIRDKVLSHAQAQPKINARSSFQTHPTPHTTPSPPASTNNQQP